MLTIAPRGEQLPLHSHPAELPPRVATDPWLPQVGLVSPRPGCPRSVDAMGLVSRTSDKSATSHVSARWRQSGHVDLHNAYAELAAWRSARRVVANSDQEGCDCWRQSRLSSACVVVCVCPGGQLRLLTIARVATAPWLPQVGLVSPRPNCPRSVDAMGLGTTFS